MRILIFFWSSIISCYVQSSYVASADRKEKTKGFSELKELEGGRPLARPMPLSWSKERSLLSRFSLGEGSTHCKRPATCTRLNYSTCMGVRLPYAETSLDLVDGLTSQEQAQDQLEEWRRLVHVPKCWAVIQQFLCALYMPRCENNTVYLPSQEMCKMMMGPCRILTTYDPWPSVFRCDNTTRYPPSCKNEVRELKFNTTGRCLEPLVQTDLAGLYYEGVEGCGIQCENPLFTSDERRQVHRLVAWSATASALFNLFTVVTFMIDWKCSSKYPALVIFYINACFLVVSLGWLAQFLPGAREDIVCRKDGTLRIAEPSAGENLSCVMVFVLVYYFLMAGIVWFVILTYAWHISFQALGKIQECMEKKGAYFHLVAWSLPLVLTIATMALGEIDADSVAGICFVGYVNMEYRAGFLLLPVFIALTIGSVFMVKGLVTLIRLKLNSQEVISARASAKIRETILRMGAFSLLVFVFTMTTFICHIYEFKNTDGWNKSFRAYILCMLGVLERGEGLECKMKSRPSLAMLQLHILSLFSTSIVMSSWVWTHSTMLTWNRFIHKKFMNKDGDRKEPQARLKKHKVIAQAFAKRKMLNDDGRLSISIYSPHQDPVGLKFELNSDGSESLGSTWAAALPNFVTRRGGIVTATNSNSSFQKNNSFDSDISYSVRRVSVESRRHSVDSAVSVKVSEVTQTVVKKANRRRSSKRMGRNHTHGGRSSRSHRHSHRTHHRRNSTTAPPSPLSSTNQSHPDLKQLVAVLNEVGKGGTRRGPRSGRRSATVGLEAAELLAKHGLGDLRQPVSSRSASSSRSDGENETLRPLVSPPTTELTVHSSTLPL